MSDLVDQAEIARRLDVQPSTVEMWRWRAQQEGFGARGAEPFPEPAHRFGQTPVWAWSVVRAWAERTGRLDHADS
jgi:hypothetical protein